MERRHFYTHLYSWLLLYRACAEQCSNNGMQTEYDTYLGGHVMERRPGIGVEGCTFACLDHADCRSINIDLTTHMCELNNATKEDFPEHLTRRPRSLHSTNDFSNKPFFEASCGDWLKRDPNLKSGYYWVKTKRKKTLAYCDMERFGGGWTLVVTISAMNSDHLQRAENNCADSTTCVIFTETDIPGRKLSDEDILDIVGTDGVFMVETAYSPMAKSGSKNKETVFYKIPSGSNNFNSSCRYTVYP
ncbi:uncharacterized protein LOC116610167 [Nematostella vectensis]|uniref:uncharacterized protein LOC116610167 n=1 Tax=Nematostella vectensis TaxID=45351 RepID=UPI0020776769|nr:uncharacterized protein LOC116610167 [Nematostella vectensis]